MDNASLWYRAQYRIAVDLAQNGRHSDALQICWDLRNDPHISLYRRAWVNLLIASLASVRSHPDKSKFAEEAIALAAQIRRNMVVDDADEQQLQRIEAEGRSRLAAIEEERFIYAAMEGSRTREEAFAAKDVATATIQEMKQTGSWPPAAPAATAVVPTTGSDTRGLGDDMLQSSADDHGELDTWTIEGAFTDHEEGQARERTGIDSSVNDNHDEQNEQHCIEGGTSAASGMELPVRPRETG